VVQQLVQNRRMRAGEPASTPGEPLITCVVFIKVHFNSNLFLKTYKSKYKLSYSDFALLKTINTLHASKNNDSIKYFYFFFLNNSEC